MGQKKVVCCPTKKLADKCYKKRGLDILGNDAWSKKRGHVYFDITGYYRGFGVPLPDYIDQGYEELSVESYLGKPKLPSNNGLRKLIL